MFHFTPISRSQWFIMKGHDQQRTGVLVLYMKLQGYGQDLRLQYKVGV